MIGRHALVGLGVRLLVTMFLVDVTAAKLADRMVRHDFPAVVEPVLYVLISAPIIWVVVVLPAMRRVGAAEQLLLEREAASRADAERQEFDVSLRRAFDMARDEASALEVVGRAVPLAAPEANVQLMLADSSEAHVRTVAEVSHVRADGCDVAAPWACPAMASGRTRVFSSSAALDACPHLRGRTEEEISAVCTPLSFLGRAIGVLHATSDAPVPDTTVERLVSLGAASGSVIGTLRAFQRSERQAATDPLTGLLNRRSLSDDVRRLESEGLPYAVVMADLDHFKNLNDVYGHDVGDRALRLFATVLRASARDHDVLGRHGGEEFLLVLPECSDTDAALAAERIREQLARAVSTGGTVPYTASFGVAASSPGTPFEDCVRNADQALLTAKRSGRDRVVLWSDDLAFPAVTTGKD